MTALKIDCDVHIPVPGMAALTPYLDDLWRDTVVARGIETMHLSATRHRAEWAGGATFGPGSVDALTADVFDTLGSDVAICSCLHGAVALYSEDLGSVLVRAVNDWVADCWLEKDSRLRASLLVHALNPGRAAEEIEHRAADRRFVQIVLLAGSQQLLGQRSYWPIFAAAEKHGLPVAIHAGGLGYHAPTPNGWPQTFAEESANQALNFQSQLISIISEGVFTKFPELKIVLMESGFAWVPQFIWRFNKMWLALRSEIPWVKERPGDIFRRHVRITSQPFDCPGEPADLERLLKHVDCDELLLFASDYPHRRFEGNDPIPPTAAATDLARKMRCDNPIATYGRLGALQ